MAMLLTAAFLVVLFMMLRTLAIKRPLTITLGVGFIASSIASVSLWFNYKSSLGEQDGIAISNKISYWLITDEVRWTQELFMDSFMYSLVITILISAFMVIGSFTGKPRKTV